METCIETILDDIIRIDLYDANNSSAPISCSIPFNVSAVTNMTVMQGQVDLGQSAGTPILSIVRSDDSMETQMSTPKHKVTEKRDIIGLVRTHTLTIPIETGFDTVQQADDALNSNDVMCILTAYDGSKYCIHFLPESCDISYEDERDDGHVGTLKYIAQSLSWLVKINDLS